jgi:hypothetical protein
MIRRHGFDAGIGSAWDDGKARLGERIGPLSKTEIRDLCTLLADMHGKA